jgi:Long-chain acyl-CoA synthetases (AMP-forming)
VLHFGDLMAEGQKLYPKESGFYATEVAQGSRNDVATIIYTSGTTGDPKGVMLSHGNFLHQTEYLPELIGMKSGHVLLSVLPVWHSFERIAQYIVVQAGSGDRLLEACGLDSPRRYAGGATTLVHLGSTHLGIDHGQCVQDHPPERRA